MTNNNYPIYPRWNTLMLLSLLAISSLSAPNISKNPFQIIDLISNSLFFLENEARYGWELSGFVEGNRTNVLAVNTFILGGDPRSRFDAYIKKTYSGLPPHDTIYFRIRVYIILQWYLNDSVIVDIGNKRISSGKLSGRSGYEQFLCDQNDWIETYDVFPFPCHYDLLGRVRHQGDNVVVKISSNVTFPGSSTIGLRNVSLLFINSTQPEMNCLTSVQVPDMFAGYCDCISENYYQDPALSECVPCNESCDQCFGPSAGECFACAFGYSFINGQCQKCPDGCIECISSDVDSFRCLRCSEDTWETMNNTCSSTCDPPFYTQELVNYTKICKFCQSGEYYLSNGSCSDNCPAPLAQNHTLYGNFCELACPSGQYLYPNHTCLPTCESPLMQSFVENVLLKCDFPCPGGHYLYPNGSCESSCDPPLLTLTVNEVNECISPCNEQMPFFYNRNMSCGVSCTSPNIIKQEGLLTKCYPSCPNGQYLYPNGSCFNSCNTPLLLVIENGVRKCVPPCQFPSVYYFDSNNSCGVTCAPPNIIMEEDILIQCIVVPNLPALDSSTPGTFSQNLTVEEIRQVQAIASAIGISGNIVGAAVALAVVLGSANPAISTIAAFVKMLPYIRYVNVSYPPKLQLMLDNLNSSIICFSFGFSMTEQMQEQFTMRNLPPTSNFEKYGFHSSFLVNYWSTLTSILMLFGALLVLIICIVLTKKLKKINVFLQGLRPVIQWNFILMIFFGNVDSIVIPTSLELRTVVFDSFQSVMSFICCILTNITALLSFYLGYYIIRDIRKNTPEGPPGSRFSLFYPEERWKNFQLFFKGAKSDSLVRHMYIIPYLIRTYFFNFILAHLYEHPLVQTILITIMSILTLGSMLWLRPFISRLVFCQHVSDELVMLAVNISMMILSILDYHNIESPSARDNIGDVIIYANLVFNITTNVYLVLYLLVGFLIGIKNMRWNKKKGILSWLITLLAPYESGGMDVDPVFGNEIPSRRRLKNTRSSIYLASMRNRQSTSNTRHTHKHQGLETLERFETERSLIKKNRRYSCHPTSPGSPFWFEQQEGGQISPKRQRKSLGKFPIRFSLFKLHEPAPSNENWFTKEADKYARIDLNHQGQEGQAFPPNVDLSPKDTNHSINMEIERSPHKGESTLSIGKTISSVALLHKKPRPRKETRSFALSKEKKKKSWEKNDSF